MDLIDKKLMRELDQDPRISLSKVAKKLRISQQVVDYRLKRLFKQKHIVKLSSVINLKALGYEDYRVFFEFSSNRKYTNKQIFSYLRNQKGIYWSSRIGGKYDLLIVLFVWNMVEFDKFIDDFNQNFPGLIKGYLPCYTIKYNIYRHKYMQKGGTTISYGYTDKKVKIDDLDHHILSKIKDNCRLSSLDLAKGQNVSYKTIINRIKSLEENNVILGYRSFIMPFKKERFIVLFSLKDYSRDKERKLFAYFEEHSKINQSIRMFGPWNIFLHMNSKNYEELQNIIIEIRDKFDIIDNFEIIPVFEDISINLMPV